MTPSPKSETFSAFATVRLPTTGDAASSRAGQWAVSVIGAKMRTSHVDLMQRYVEALLAPDWAEALRLVRVEAIASGVSIERLYLDVIAAAQHEIGRLWQQNRITVAQEHIATGIAHLSLAQLYPSLPRATPNGKLLLVACVPGETHELGVRMVADFCEMAGFDVRFLGGDVPAESIVRMILETQPDVVALGVTVPFNVPSLRETLDTIRSAVGDALPIVAGGQALADQDARATVHGATICTGDALEAASLLKSVVGKAVGDGAT